MENIIVLGGGFGGIACALRLETLLQSEIRTKKYKIYLVDKNHYHLFTPSLYEVSTVEEPQGNIAIPLEEIFFKKKVTLFYKKVDNINPDRKTVHFSDGVTLSYAYLVCALGSVSNTYDIPGVDEYAHSLKTLQDAVALKRHLFSLLKSEEKELRIVIAGGGFSGTELAAEFLRYKRYLETTNIGKQKNIRIMLVSGSAPVAELGEKTARSVLRRLSKLQLDMVIGEHVKEFTKDAVILTSGRSIPYALAVWAGGVKANGSIFTYFQTDKNGRIQVNNFLQAQGEDRVFAIGDNALFLNPKTNRPAEGVAETAIGEGRIVAENIYRAIKGKTLKQYTHHPFGYIVPVSGKYAYVHFTFLHVQGFIGWVIQQFTFMNYLLSILPFHKAFAHWNKFERHLHD